MFLPAFVCLFVCLSVCLLARVLKMHAWIWIKCCVSTDVGTWTNWLTFEPYPDYIPGAGTGLLSPISYKRGYAEFYVGKIRRIRIGGPPLESGMVLKWFYSLSRRNTFAGGTCALPSALLVLSSFFFNFCLFVPCGGLSWLHANFLLHVNFVVKHTLSYLLNSLYIGAMRSQRSVTVDFWWYTCINLLYTGPM